MSCPEDIKKGHCDECLAKKLKTCERCNSKEEVKYYHSFMLDDWVCWCWDCRVNDGSIASMCRSY